MKRTFYICKTDFCNARCFNSAVLLVRVSCGVLANGASETGTTDTRYNFPVISIDTDNGAPIVDKTNYVGCKVSIDNTSSQYLLDDTVGGIRYRGNSTLQNAEKKAYRIKFDKKQNLFGMGKQKAGFCLQMRLIKRWCETRSLLKLHRARIWNTRRNTGL